MNTETENNEKPVDSLDCENRHVRTIKLKLVGLDGNAFALMGAFSRQARKEGWTRPEIDAVRTDCRSGDYNNLLRVLDSHCS